MAYYNLEPFGEIQLEYRAGFVASVIANTARDEKKHKEPFKAVEFMREIYLDKQETREIDQDRFTEKTYREPRKSVEADPNKILMAKAMAIFRNLGAKKKG